MIIEILLGVTIILSGVLGWTTYNQLQKVERLEDWIENYSARLIQTQTLLKELGRLSEQMDASNAWTLEQQCQEVLRRLGIKDFNKKIIV